MKVILFKRNMCYRSMPKPVILISSRIVLAARTTVLSYEFKEPVISRVAVTRV